MIPFVVLAGLLSLSGCGFLRPGPSQVAGKFIQNVERAQYQDAVQLVSTRLRQMIGDSKLIAGLEGANKEIKAKGGIASITPESEEITGDVARVTQRIEYKNGTKASDKAKLIKEADGWKIDADK